MRQNDLSSKQGSVALSILAFGIFSFFLLLSTGAQVSGTDLTPAEYSTPRVSTQASLQGGNDKLQKYPIDEKLEGPESRYTQYLINIIRNGASKINSKNQDKNPVQLQCIETPGNSFFIGVRQEMIVDAPLEKVEAVLDDMNHYRALFPGFDDIHIISRDGNKILTYWEQHIPLFFVPNVHYQVVYLLDKLSKDRKVYRYKLKEGENLKSNDGLIVIERDTGSVSGFERTHYYEYDFYDADWGIIKTLAPGRIWKDSVEGIYLSDVAIKLRAEHPDWSFEKIVDESKKILSIFPVENVIKEKVTLDVKSLIVKNPI